MTARPRAYSHPQVRARLTALGPANEWIRMVIEDPNSRLSLSGMYRTPLAPELGMQLAVKIGNLYVVRCAGAAKAYEIFVRAENANELQDHLHYGSESLEVFDRFVRALPNSRGGESVDLTLSASLLEALSSVHEASVYAPGFDPQDVFCVGSAEGGGFTPLSGVGV